MGTHSVHVPGDSYREKKVTEHKAMAIESINVKCVIVGTNVLRKH